MEFKSFINTIYKRLWIIIAIPFISSIITALVTFYVIKPVYESNMSLYVINKGINQDISVIYNDILVGQQLVKDYRDIIKSRSVVKAAIQELDIRDLSVEELSKNIHVNLKNDTRILEIRVRDIYRHRARDLTEKIAQIFTEKITDIMGVEGIRVIDDPEIPAMPVSPKPFVDTLLAFIVGLLAAFGIILLLEYMDDTIKDSIEVEKFLKMKVVGIIPSNNIK